MMRAKVNGRPSISMKSSKYPEQADVRLALNDFTFSHKTQYAAAKVLGCTFRELSNWRHGVRWIPDHIVKRFGFNPEVFRSDLQLRKEMQFECGAVKRIGGNEVVRAARQFVKIMRSDCKSKKHMASWRTLVATVESYEASQ
jgi:hypothetical protein